MSGRLDGKILLVIGGAAQHCKVVEAAHELGVITYVTDYLPPEKAPAKQIADKYFMYNITEISEIVAMCKAEGVEGVISTSLDICQKPYQQICEKLGMPCFGTREQFDILTDKKKFKECCRNNGVDTIPEYSEFLFAGSEADVAEVDFPVLVKPGESRGSRGQSVCNSLQEVRNAIPFAREVSSNGQVVIEKYMGQKNDFSMSVLMLNGKAIPIRTVDRVLGRYEDKLDKLAVGSATPSVFTDMYLNNVHEKIERLYKKIGIVTAPLFMQGFVDGNVIRFYDPGLRFGGSEFERVFSAVTGRNPFYPLIEYALTGEVSEDLGAWGTSDVWLQEKTTVQVFPALKAGKISAVYGLDEIRMHPDVVCVFTRYGVGDVIEETHNVNQRFAEIDIVCQNNSDMKKMVEWVFDKLKVCDEFGNDMIVSQYDVSIFDKRIDIFGK